MVLSITWNDLVLIYLLSYYSSLLSLFIMIQPMNRIEKVILKSIKKKWKKAHRGSSKSNSFNSFQELAFLSSSMRSGERRYSL